MSSCEIDFQGQVIPVERQKGSEEGSVMASNDSECDVSIASTLLERRCESGDSSSAVMEPDLKRTKDSSPSVQSGGVVAKKPTVCHLPKDPGLQSDANSGEECSKRNGSIAHKESSACQDSPHGPTSSQGKSAPMEVTASEVQTSPHGCRWREVADKEGRTVYVDLHTGNSSYEPPEVVDNPEWTSSQPLGAPLPKVPITHEPWYIPRGKAQRERDSFTLTHGFSDLRSWKKTIEMRKKEDANRTSAAGNTCSKLGDGGTNTAPSGRSQEVQEALEAFLEDLEADEDFVKWTEKPGVVPQEPAQPSEVAQICQMWEPPDFAMDTEVLNIRPGAGGGSRRGSVRVYNMLHPYTFTKEMLESCEVAGQLDQKFIACSLRYTNPEGPPGHTQKLVVLFDQHAVHERVRLEAVIRDNCETLDSGVTVLRRSAVIPPLELDLPEDEVRLMGAFSEKFRQRGLCFTRASPSKVLFHFIPACLVAKAAGEARWKHCRTAAAVVESLVRDLCYTLIHTGGVLSAIPPPITHVFNNNACRGAIKFGDVLSIRECQDLITSLCSCQLPFQCAHGRPSVVPVVNLTHLAARTPKRFSKPNLRRLREAMEARTAT